PRWSTVLWTLPVRPCRCSNGVGRRLRTRSPSHYRSALPSGPCRNPISDSLRQRLSFSRMPRQPTSSSKVRFLFKQQCAGNAETTMPLMLTSPAIPPGGEIAAQYTCDGADISPPLTWSSLPNGTQSLVLVVEDPDAPSGVFRHWTVFNI